jgi:hypothetical protein
MADAGPRKGRERFRYHYGCASPKQYLAQCERRIAAAPGRIAKIQADLAEAQRRATEQIAAVQAEVSDAERRRDSMRFMLDENGRYVGSRLPAMRERYGLDPEDLPNQSSKRPRGRPRKDGRPPQPRSEEARTKDRARRAAKLVPKATISHKPKKARQRTTTSLISDTQGQQIIESPPLQIDGTSSVGITEGEITPADRDATSGASSIGPVGDELGPATPLAPAAPLLFVSLGQQVEHLLNGVADDDDLPTEMLTLADKLVDVFTPETDAERVTLRDESRWPPEYVPTWADNWDPDPRSPLPMTYNSHLIIACRSGPERIKLWPLAIQRRDTIKALMERVAVGELTFEPVSMRQDDLERSVRWLVFRNADHDWLFDLSRHEIRSYTQQLLDVIPWPPGLSRVDLLETFGCEQDQRQLPNMSSYGRPPLWMVPEENWIHAEHFGLRHASGVDPAYKDRPRPQRVLDDTVQPCRTTRRRERDLSSGSTMPAPPLPDLAALYSSAERGNRLLEMKPDARTGYLSFAYPADVVRAELASGETVRLGAGHLQVQAEWCGTDLIPLDPDLSLARAARLSRLARETAENTGLSALTIAYGIAFYGPGDLKLAAPLAVCPVALSHDGEAFYLRRTGIPEWNKELLAVLGVDDASLPIDPLAWEPTAHKAAGIDTILPIATLGIFDLARHRHGRRLDPRQDRDLLEHPQVRRLLEGRTEPVWPQQPWRMVTTPTQMTASLDRSQADVVDASREGLSFVVEGGPGTGKTQTISHILINAAADGRSVLFLTGRLSAFRSALTRLGSVADDCLQLYGVDCDPARIAAWCGTELGSTVRETLECIDADAHPCVVMATPATYVTHVPPEWGFDLLVVDEASLIPLASALPALAACTQIIICGDPNQMQRDPQPWVLFDREKPYVQPATLIDAAIAAGMPKATLTHHYRSRHPRLMHVSNRLSYGGRMWMCPSPSTDHNLGFFASRVDGTFDRKAMTNFVEAKAIVEEIERYTATGGRGSIGVITMTQQQRDLVRGLVTGRGLDCGKGAEGEELLIADYNGVQGEERDVILISMTFGRRPGEGAWPMSFGAISMPGGEKRLNVIMTRARERMVLFTSFPKEAVEPSRCAGHANLYTYMLAAERAYCDEGEPWHDGIVSSHVSGQYEAMLFGNAIGLRKPKTDHFVAVLYITGRTDELTERSEIAQYRKLGWILVELSQDELTAAHQDYSIITDIKDNIRISIANPTRIMDFSSFRRR